MSENEHREKLRMFLRKKDSRDRQEKELVNNSNQVMRFKIINESKIR
jgi:hypothetical protein